MKKWEKFLLVFNFILMIGLFVLNPKEYIYVLCFSMGIEIINSYFISIIVLFPLSKIFSKNNSKQIFWLLFGIRIAILLTFDFLGFLYICIFDFLAMLFGVCVVVPIAFMIKMIFQLKPKDNDTLNSKVPNDLINHMQELVNNIPSNNLIKHQYNRDVIINCNKCGGVLKVTDKVCLNCGTQFEKNNIEFTIKPKVSVNKSNFNMTMDEVLEEVINKEIARAGIDINSNLIPAKIKKRKDILNIIFAVLTFVYVALIFFHVSIYFYVIGIIILFISFKITKRYNFMKYLKKEINARPSEKISNIVMDVKNSFVTDTTKSFKFFSFLVAIVLALLIFMNPRIIYEKVDNGYAVRFYTFGLTNFKTVTIPETYKGEKVVSLSGNTFSNMFFLETVNLPNTITEIRDQAFRNDINLVSINIPTNLEYLGDSAFYNCSSITNIVLPDTLTYMGEETFYGASSLSEIKLSANLTEIRENSFENCTSLSEVNIPSNSRLEKIGSLAFKNCSNLHIIRIPYGVVYKDNAFKESPTRIDYFSSLYY